AGTSSRAPQTATPPGPIAQPAELSAPTPTPASTAPSTAASPGGHGGQPARTPTAAAPTVLPPARTNAPANPAPAGHLSATYQTLKVMPNGNYLAQVSMTATGGTVSGWTVVITVPAGAVVALTSGASVAQDGTLVTFTPDGNAQVHTGQIVSFTFRVRRPAGTTAPLSCTANGRSCAGI
ncbi:MAG TPA: cellulose binding domain-containing protein, partial [Rugosimonospora sp.]|nr:cellulose binding domain-containing protein [Rugosimonospora sp.]